uniref:ESPR-type extended signal peptide-containing protein n=1 Tax=Dialister sp. TaxID=1955814 RepID=UPI0040278353
MNHIYKVIWNHAKHCYTVVSEIAKSHKNSSNGGSNKKAAALAVALSLACCYGVVSVEAQITETESKYNIETGKIKTVKDDHDNPEASPYVTKADMAIGTSSVAKGSHSTAIGNQSNVDGDYSLAIGYNSKIIKGSSSMAIGNSSEAHDTATAVGAQSYAASSATAIGMNSKSTAMGGVSIGVSSMVGNAGGIAIGRAAKNVSSDGTNQKSGIAIGDFSNAQGEQSFAIGPSANALGNYSIAFGEGARTESGTTWATVLGHASTIGKNATYSTIIGSLSSISEGATWSTIIGANSSISGNANNSTAVGGYTKVSASCGTALGTSSAVTAENGTALGGFSSVTAKDGVSIGVSSIANRAAGVLGYLADTGTTEITWKANAGAVSVGSSSMTRQIINVAAGTNDTDAVNVAQLKKALESIDVDAGTGIKVDKIIKDGKTTYKISTNIVGSETATDKTTVDKTTVTTNQTHTGNTDTSQGTTNGTNTKTGETVTVSTETKATHFGADGNQKADVKPGGTLNVNGDGSNILTSISTSTSDNSSSIKVKLNKDITVDSVTANSVKVGDTSITTDGLTIKDGPSITKTGINGGDKKVTHVAAGDISEKSTDAVNGSQLFATNQQVAQNAQSISKLGNRINKVGAGAAALAALHPLDFDPDDKWDFAAGYGNYNGENAAAIGAYYRPNEDTMFSVGGSFGNGENMVNAGVSLKLGQGNHVSTSKVAMAKEIKDLRKELEGLKSALLDANAGKKLDTSKLQLFPDVPKNHWAYEYVSTLKGNGALTGYPDGEFKGDRPMTRYEFATMLYKAMLEGATLSDKILKEFAPELERFTVDTVHQDKDGKPTVERVRTVKAEK